MIAIYSVVCKFNNKRYVGKSRNVKQRFSQHKYDLKKETKNKDCNRHLFNAVKKYGIENFDFVILEEFESISENDLKDKELYWMDFYNSCDRAFGYNLRRDSSTETTMSDETKSIKSLLSKGENNPNYKNKWSDSQKQRMSDIAKERHRTGLHYGNEWKSKQSIKSTLMWKDLNKKNQMAEKVKLAKRQFIFHQYDLNDNFIKTWYSVEDILFSNPTWKWQNIYSVCNGYKPTYRGFKWKKEKLNKK